MTVTYIFVTLRNLNPEETNQLKQVHGGIIHIMHLPDWQPKGVSHLHLLDTKGILLNYAKLL